MGAFSRGSRNGHPSRKRPRASDGTATRSAAARRPLLNETAFPSRPAAPAPDRFDAAAPVAARPERRGPNGATVRSPCSRASCSRLATRRSSRSRLEHVGRRRRRTRRPRRRRRAAARRSESALQPLLRALEPAARGGSWRPRDARRVAVRGDAVGRERRVRLVRREQRGGRRGGGAAPARRGACAACDPRGRGGVLAVRRGAVARLLVRRCRAAALLPRGRAAQGRWRQHDRDAAGQRGQYDRRREWIALVCGTAFAAYARATAADFASPAAAGPAPSHAAGHCYDASASSQAAQAYLFAL